MELQNSVKSISPLPSMSISPIMASICEGLSFNPTASRSVSRSSAPMVPVSFHSAREMLLSEPAAERAWLSCLKRQKICLNSSLSSSVMPRFLMTFSSCIACRSFLEGSFSAARMARSNSLTLTSPPPSLSMTAMMDVRSASVSLKPRSCKPIRSSSPVTLPSPLASIFLKRSLARSLFFFRSSATLFINSSAWLVKWGPVSTTFGGGASEIPMAVSDALSAMATALQALGRNVA
mmetsp:Transcript_43388/g.71561  ORF Transcript_43388/g.71561 Transcript_43388/m.71561 type:complete len:235 (-) Transcript_43388:7-711(-)